MVWGSCYKCQPWWIVFLSVHLFLFLRNPALFFSHSRRPHLTSLCFSMVAYSFCERSLETLGMPGFFLLPLLRLLLFLLVFLLFFFLAFLLSPFVTYRTVQRRQENVNVLLGRDLNNINGKKILLSLKLESIMLCLPSAALITFSFLSCYLQ